MDLVSERYANPCFIMDGFIRTGRFEEFVISFVKTVNEEKEEKHSWEFFLHKVLDKSYQEFRSEIETNKQNQNMSEKTIEATINDSLSILNKFNPNDDKN